MKKVVWTLFVVLLASMPVFGQAPDRPAQTISSARLLQLAQGARESSGGSPDRAVAAFAAAWKRESNGWPIQGTSLAKGLEADLDIHLGDESIRPTIYAETQQDRTFRELFSELEGLDPLDVGPRGVLGVRNAGVCLFVAQPERSEVVDVERILLIRNGRRVPELTGAEFIVSEFGHRLGVYRHFGTVCWPLASFDPSSGSPHLVLDLNGGWRPLTSDINQMVFNQLSGRCSVDNPYIPEFGCDKSGRR